ncbi:MAG: hypothetical protein APF76_16340 [Desulfitibacter sp. BRH_c19]|nr:MAG: hypothetical protein APF76_16340 [Desulfitibacter sp. BRH_c19]
MQVVVKYLSVLIPITRKKSEIIQLEGETSIENLVEILCDKYGTRFMGMIYMQSNSRKYFVHFLVKNQAVDDTYYLKDGDEVTILLALGGG